MLARTFVALLFVLLSLLPASPLYAQTTDPVIEVKELAKEGSVFAQGLLGDMYKSGEGVPQDFAEAVKWYHKAAEQGDPRAQTILGLMYEKGKGVPQDFAEAVKWYRKAAEQGNADGQVLLGGLYNSGRGVPQDNEEAYFWLNLGAVTGNKEAAEARNLTAEILSPEARSAVQKRSREWKPTAPAAQGKQ